MSFFKKDKEGNNTSSNDGPQDVSSQLKRIMDQLGFLEKKIDTLLEQSQNRGNGRPSFGGGPRPFGNRGGFQGRPGGFRGNREGGPPREGGFNGAPRREGGFSGTRREGNFNADTRQEEPPQEERSRRPTPAHIINPPIST